MLMHFITILIKSESLIKIEVRFYHIHMFKAYSLRTQCLHVLPHGASTQSGVTSDGL